jgi:hypothetical protein
MMPHRREAPTLPKCKASLGERTSAQIFPESVVLAFA